MVQHGNINYCASTKEEEQQEGLNLILLVKQTLSMKERLVLHNYAKQP